YWDVDGIFPFVIHWDGSSWTPVDAPGIMRDLHVFAPDDIYGVGSGVFHYDGEAWSIVETFPDVDGPALAGMDAAGPCDLWAGGRQIDPATGEIEALTVRSLGGDAGLSLSQTPLQRGKLTEFTATG